MAEKKKKVSRPGHTPPKRAQEERGGRRNDGERKLFDNTNRGALFLNDKDGNEARPDYTGTVDIEVPDGTKPGDVVKFRVAGWIKQPNAGGSDYLSLSIQKADTQGGNRRGKKAESKD